MTFNIYENKSDKITVNKNIQLLESYEGYLREGCSITEPVIRVEGIFNVFNNGNANYIFLPDYRRYYYITDIIQLRANLVEIHAKVDVLMSFKDELKNCRGIVQKNATQYNMYLDDGSYKVLGNRTLITTEFPSGFNTERFIMVTAG